MCIFRRLLNFTRSGNSIYLLKGKITEEFGFYTVEVEYMQRLDYWNRAPD